MTSLSFVAVAVGYLVGSFPTAWLVVRYISAERADVRRLGDGNAGATNVGRLFGARWGVIVGIVDLFKGFAVVSVFNLLAEAASQGGAYEQYVLVPGMLAGASGVVGHIWPACLGFRGGRGAAIAVGVAGAVFTMPMLLLSLPTALILLVTRNTSIAFCVIYYLTLICAKVFFGADWALILCCWILSFPVVLTDPKIRGGRHRTRHSRWWRHPDPAGKEKQ